jgi:hypothetical protein
MPEREVNARLRRADWRFLLPAPRPRRAFCCAGTVLTEAVASVAGELATSETAHDCDLAVGEDPDPSMLARLYGALRPGGACYTEWHSLAGGAGRVERALRSVGFSSVTCYRPWPSAVAPLYWIPLGAPGAAAYVRSRRRLRGGRLRRLIVGIRQRTRNLLSGRRGAPICAIASRPADATSDEPDFTAWLMRSWPTWGLGPSPERLSMLLVTGGPRSVSKAVLLGFAEPGPVPRIAIKAPRVDAAAAGVRREGAVLASLGERRPVPGIPRLLFRREVEGVPLVGETALAGRPLEHLLGARSLRAWSLRVADWLAALAVGEQERSAAHWRDTIVEPALALFTDQFGRVADRGLLRESEGIVRAIGALPAVPEQRDFGPWNLLVMPEGDLGVLDWESADANGLPLLDLLYFLAYASFNVDRAHHRDARVSSYRRSLDASTPTGVVRRECVARYADALGLERGALGPLRVLLWMIHAPSDFRHAVADAGGLPPAPALAQSLFLALWAEEVRHTAGA